MAGARPDEDGLIARFFAPLATHPGAVGLTDDAAVVAPPPGHELVVTTDALVAGVHFFPNDELFNVARKALRVNLSDLAAKGADPLGYLLTLALPADWTVGQLERLSAGLAADQAEFGVTLLGGDTVKTPGPLTLSVTALGALPAGGAIRRGGARPGDAILVTGSIGDASLGCRILYDPAAGATLTPEHISQAKQRYWVPEPRIAIAPVLREFASAAMDVSDGFVGDLAKLCRVSRVSAIVDAEDVPLGPASDALARVDASHLAALLTGGDDYEVLFTVPDKDGRPGAAIRAARPRGIDVRRVGTIVEGEAVIVLRAGVPMTFATTSYNHF